MKVRDQRQEQLRDFGELFDITARRHKGNEQSTAAFHVIKDKISASQDRILQTIRAHLDGLTCDELAVMFKCTPNEISGRCSELKRTGKIYKSGTRKTRSGCSAAILKAFA
jgi:hypothetical protein